MIWIQNSAIWIFLTKLIQNVLGLKSGEILHAHDYFSVTQSFWNFVQSMAISLLYSVQNFKMIGQLKLISGQTRFHEISKFQMSLGGISYNIVTATATPHISHIFLAGEATYITSRWMSVSEYQFHIRNIHNPAKLTDTYKVFDKMTEHQKWDRYPLILIV